MANRVAITEYKVIEDGKLQSTFDLSVDGDAPRRVANPVNALIGLAIRGKISGIGTPVHTYPDRDGRHVSFASPFEYAQNFGKVVN